MKQLYSGMNYPYTHIQSPTATTVSYWVVTTIHSDTYQSQWTGAAVVADTQYGYPQYVHVCDYGQFQI